MTSYQGWENYATWAVALWIDNSEGDQEYITELVNSCENVYRAGDALEQWADDALDMWMEGRKSAGLFNDLLTWALGQTNWIEVAEHFWDEELHKEDDTEA